MGVELMETHVSDIPRLTFDSVGFAEEDVLNKLQVHLAEIGKSLSSIFNDFSVRLLNCSTVEDFRSLRKKLFPRYIKLILGLSSIVLAEIKPEEFAQLEEQSLSKVEKEFMSRASLYLGDEAYKEALFSISTLNSAHRLTLRLMTIPPSDKSKDKELSEKYFLNTTWAHFHLSCLRFAVRQGKPINQDILQELLDGLRTSVMAYACVRAALDLRNINKDRYSERLDVEWDDEDDALANAP